MMIKDTWCARWPRPTLAYNTELNSINLSSVFSYRYHLNSLASFEQPITELGIKNLLLVIPKKWQHHAYPISSGILLMRLDPSQKRKIVVV